MLSTTTSAARAAASRAACMTSRATTTVALRMPMHSRQSLNSRAWSSAGHAHAGRLNTASQWGSPLASSRSAALSARAMYSPVVLSGAVVGSENAMKLGLPEGELPKWEIRMLFDGDCPLCMREVNMLRDMDKDNGKIDFVDISSEDYEPAKNMDLEFETVMKSIHAILPDGTVISGVEVFRRLYEAVGLGWIYAITKNPTVGRVAENVYDFWARNRMAVTGRPELEVILAEKKTCRDVSAPPTIKKE